MDRRFFSDDASFSLSTLLLVTTHQVHTADNSLVVLRHHLYDFARTTLITAGEHDDLVALLNLLHPSGSYSTSGAREMIFMWFLARSSRGTGPKIRVPIGSFLLSTRTAAFVSKWMTLPSGRRMSLAVRTTTAFITSPFLTRPRGIASLIDTTMMSPTEAYFRFEPPSTLMHMTRRAPELSATSRFVCI